MSEIIKSNDYDERDFFKEQINDCVETVMSEDFEKYLAIANHDIQMANNTAELKSYVASILYDNDKKVELLQQKDNIIKDIKAQLDYLETYSSKEDVYEDMKRRLDRIEKIIGENNDK